MLLSCCRSSFSGVLRQHFVSRIVFSVADAVDKNPASKTERPHRNDDERNDVADRRVVGARLVELDGGFLVLVRAGGFAEGKAENGEEELHAGPARVDKGVCVCEEEDDVEGEVGWDRDAQTDAPNGSETIDNDITSRIKIDDHLTVFVVFKVFCLLKK